MRELKENIHIQTVAKLLIAVAAIAHLIFTYVHTSALLLLENQIDTLSTASTSCPMESNVVATELPNTSQSDDQNAPVVARHAIILSAAMRGDAPVPPSWTPPILRAAVNGTASTS